MVARGGDRTGHPFHGAGPRSGHSFAIFVGWAAPHWPYDQYPQEFNTYDPDGIPLRPNVPEPLEAYAQGELAQYYGNISALDAMMGRLLEALERLGLAEDTLVCFTSDHGDHLWSHGFGRPYDEWLHPTRRGNKMTPYDESVHVPFIARWPGRVPVAEHCDALFSSVDVRPTLLSLCGIEPPDAIAGMNLSHLLTGDAGPRRDAVYLQNMGYGWPPRREGIGFWRGVRTERWTYARWLHHEMGPLLFDRQSDPYEMENLAGREEFAETEAELEGRLRRFMDETGDPFETGERDAAFGMLKLGQRFADERWAEIERERQA
ncbi:MAG: sulfatase-like hydrolase/transferase [Candidatus Brocadiia bacterium]